jgi:hypothetical protein
LSDAFNLNQESSFMKTTEYVLGILSAASLLLMVSITSADLIAPPKNPNNDVRTVIPLQQETLTGTLAWKAPSSSTSTKQKKTLQLTTADKKVIDIPAVTSGRATLNYDQFVGKMVEIKVLTEKAKNAKGQPVTNIKSIAAIKEAPRSKS